MSAVDVPLSTTEQERLAECEAKIRSGLQTFVDVGRALAEIRDSRLYRQTHETFEAYCGMEFGLTRKRAYDLMGASDIIDALAEINGTSEHDSEHGDGVSPIGDTDEPVSPMGDIPLPATESQARELAGLDAPAAAEVMRKARDATDGKITAAAIASARQEVAPKPSKFTKLHNDVLVNKETGEVVDTSGAAGGLTIPSTPARGANSAEDVPPGFTTDNPAAIAAAERRKFYSEAWPVFTTKLLPDLKKWGEWYALAEVGGADGITESFNGMPLHGPEDAARAIAALDRATEWITQLRGALDRVARPLRSVR